MCPLVSSISRGCHLWTLKTNSTPITYKHRMFIQRYCMGATVNLSFDEDFLARIDRQAEQDSRLRGNDNEMSQYQ